VCHLFFLTAIILDVTEMARVAGEGGDGEELNGRCPDVE
jgi:hypothetical protein